MKVRNLKYEQVLPIDIEEAWEFFSNPGNLDLITPDDMSFEILSGAEAKMYAGQVITYKIAPILNIKMNWVTEITQCKDLQFFIDEQRFGPYKFWHHQHHFSEVENGVQMKDILHYALPFGSIGELVAGNMVHTKVRNIFKFRELKLNEIFKIYPLSKTA